MQLTFFALVSMVVVAWAVPVPMPEALDDIVDRATTTSEGAAMTQADGTIVDFNSADVYLAAAGTK